LLAVIWVSAAGWGNGAGEGGESSGLSTSRVDWYPVKELGSIL